jgi:hypothetical protein
MSHEMVGYNNARVEIANAYFSMGNYNALVLYDLLDSLNYYAGVSGSGGFSTFSKQQIENALNAFQELCNNDISSNSSSDHLPWDQKQILDFIRNCLATAQKEGSVDVYFG